MVAPVASGTLAGSPSVSWASIHKEAAHSDFSRFRRHPPGRMARTTLTTVAESDIVVGHDFRNREKQQLGDRRHRGCEIRSSVRERRRREPAVVCQQPSVVRSPQFGDRRRSQPRGRRDYRNRGKALARSRPRQRLLLGGCDRAVQHAQSPTGAIGTSPLQSWAVRRGRERMRSSARTRHPRCGKQASRPRAMSWERSRSLATCDRALPARVTGRCWITPEAVMSLRWPLRTNCSRVVPSARGVVPSS
jgi:hypothetical protein